MKRGAELFSSFDRSWSEFSKAWNKTRRRASEKSVHALRVNTRRLIANLELARVLSEHSAITKLQQRFKKVVKRMSALRDLQVQLKTVSHVRKSQTILEFTRRLQKVERRQIENVSDALKRRKKRRLEAAFKEVRSALDGVRQNHNRDGVQQSLVQIMSAHQHQFLKAKRRFGRSASHSENALHDMRIALKKLRYVMEAAQPLLGPSEKHRVEAMRVFQKLIGDARDIEMLRVELDQWAKKKGKKVAVVPALQQLEEKRQALLKEVIESSDKLESLMDIKRSAPIAETTQVAQTPAAAVSPVKS
jgi:CHAD domain-containing protein